MAVKTHPPDPKQHLILTAAFDRFAAYGFRRTSMEDIARGAAMSRPALYLHFANKEAILQALVARYHADAACALEQALSQPASVEDILIRAFRPADESLVRTLLTSPHGLELLDSTEQLSGALVRQGQTRLTEIYATWLENGSRDGTLTLPASPNVMADLIVTTVAGLKAPPFEIYLQRLDTMARIFARALTPPA